MIAGIESYFGDLSASLSAFLQGNEIFTCNFSAEQSDFVRLNHAKIRQAGRVDQAYLNLRLADGRKQASASLTLSGDLGADLALCRSTFETLRAVLPQLNEDPLYSINTASFSSRSARTSQLPSASDMIESIVEGARDADLVGFLATGPLQRGFANSLGQCNWHEVTSFNFEWSLYHQADKAVKTSYADFQWNADTFAQKMQVAHDRLGALRRTPKKISPGNYRVYLAPAALAEILSMMTWGGFSEKTRRTRQSPLQSLVEGDAKLHHSVHIKENTARGLAPAVQSDGFARPACIDLIKGGENVTALISPRTAREYGLAQNGADDNAEVPLSMDVAPGNLPNASVLKELGTGLYINNLWYLNFSDRMNARITGMTRFATFWVENGEIVAPCEVMRFDDGLFSMLGPNLLALTAEREFLPDSITYMERVPASVHTPGALIQDFRLTL